MRFTLEVDLDQSAVAEDPVGELGRALRYWAGNLKHFQLTLGDEQVIYVSTYTAVGSWRIDE